VVVHADRRARAFRGELEAAFDEHETERAARDDPVIVGASLDLISTRAAEWGTFGLLDATLDAARLLLERQPGLSHIVLMSGSCLPLRPHAELCAYLATRPGVKFIESVPAKDGAWVKGGLSMERFTLWFPFAWKRHRWLFDRLVDLQRLIGVRRRIPDGLTPHFGSQWWCLPARTLRALLADPRLPEFRRFFRRSWIPDESFFQTLVRYVDPGGVVAPPLVLTRFDEAGVPFIFYDDHEGLLARSDFFFARKISPWAVGLRRRFLSTRTSRGTSAFVCRINETPFADASRRRSREHYGLQTHARMPVGCNHEVVETARPYGVLVSENMAMLARATTWIEKARPNAVVHRRLFAPEGAGLAGRGYFYKGNLSIDPRLRDYRPEQFLSRLIWADRDQPMIFSLPIDENDRIARMILRDGNARILLIAESYEEAPMIAEMAARPPEPNGWVPPPETVYARIARVSPDELTQLMAETADGSVILDALGLAEPAHPGQAPGKGRLRQASA